jgi:MYXO-CTERM domain-containing protein
MGAYFSDGSAANGGPTPLVVQDSIGPYDYAVLKADDKTAMLGWLAANRYFVPAGTDDVVAPYLHTGAYFLALKLHSGQSAGDLQPVVINYASDLPMIPIVLTSAGAQPHMGIAVWLLGDARAIPRNYYHVVIDDALLDWPNGAFDYEDVLQRAVAEAPEKHAFVTEYAGSSSVMKGQLDYPGRFGDATALSQITDPSMYLDYLKSNGFYFNGALLAILQKYIPMPASLGVNAATYYYNFDYYYSGIGRQLNPNAFNGLNFNYDPVALTSEIEMRVVAPTQSASALFDTYPYLTRLFTKLSPEDMTRDPVFSQNPFLPDVATVHEGKYVLTCSTTQQYNYDGTVVTEEGFSVAYPNGVQQALPGVPAALRVEILREDGPPEVVTDNSMAIARALGTPQLLPGPMRGGAGNQLAGDGGCSVEPHPSRPWRALGALLLGVALVIARRRWSGR